MCTRLLKIICTVSLPSENAGILNEQKTVQMHFCKFVSLKWCNRTVSSASHPTTQTTFIQVFSSVRSHFNLVKNSQAFYLSVHAAVCISGL